MNPYASLTTESPLEVADRARSLLPAWIWLAFAAVAPIMVAPADPISVIIAAASGWSCFIAGAIQGSRSPPLVLRLVLLLTLTFPGITLALSHANSYFIIAGVVYVVVSATLGYWVSRRIPNGRVRILGCFIIGFFFGSFFGVVGSVVGAVFGVKLAERWIRSRRLESRPTSPE